MSILFEIQPIITVYGELCIIMSVFVPLFCIYLIYMITLLS